MNTTQWYEEPAIPAEVAKHVQDQIRQKPRRPILLVGGAGYVGGAIVRHLLQRGYRVRVLDRLVYGHAGSAVAFQGCNGYEFIYGDMGDETALHEALDGVSSVVVLAGLVGDPITRKYPDQSRAINEDAVAKCFSQLRGKGIERVIFVSTCSNYGVIPKGHLAREDDPLKPLSLYAEAKVTAEHLLLDMAKSSDFDPVVLRFATAFGCAPRMRFDLTVNQFTRDLFTDKALTVYDADTWRPYCHVNDFARLIERTLEWPREDVSGQIFNAGGENGNYTKTGIVEIIGRLIPDGRISVKGESSDRRDYRVDFSKVRKIMHFEPIHDVPYGVAELVDLLSKRVYTDYKSRANFYGNLELSDA